MGNASRCFCPQSPESEPLLYNAKQFTRYEIVLHKPPPMKDWIVISNIARDEYVVEKVNYYVLKEWGVKPGHLLRQVQRDRVQANVHPFRGIESRKYPLTIVFAKRRKTVPAAVDDGDDTSEEISRDSLVFKKGIGLYSSPPLSKNIRDLNHRDLVVKTEELEARLNNLHKKFKKDRDKYVKKSQEYKAQDLQRQKTLQHRLREEELRSEKARTVAGTNDPRNYSKLKLTKELSSKSLVKSTDGSRDKKRSAVFEGYLMKYGAQGSKKPKRKWVKFYLGTPKDAEGEGAQEKKKIILQYSDEVWNLDKGGSIKEMIVTRRMEAYDMKTSDSEAIKKTQFGVWVADEKAEKGIVFGSENEDTRNAWVRFVEALEDTLKNHGDEKNIFNVKQKGR